MLFVVYVVCSKSVCVFCTGRYLLQALCLLYHPFPWINQIIIIIIIKYVPSERHVSTDVSGLYNGHNL